MMICSCFKNFQKASCDGKYLIVTHICVINDLLLIKTNGILCLLKTSDSIQLFTYMFNTFHCNR